MAIVEVSIFPISIRVTNIYGCIAKAVAIIQESSFSCELAEMGKIISAGLGEIWNVFKQIHQSRLMPTRKGSSHKSK